MCRSEGSPPKKTKKSKVKQFEIKKKDGVKKNNPNEKEKIKINRIGKKKLEKKKGVVVSNRRTLNNICNEIKRHKKLKTEDDSDESIIDSEPGEHTSSSDELSEADLKEV